MESLRKKAIGGLVWSFAQQFGMQIVVFGISILLARVLEPAEYGLIGMISILMAVGNVLVDSGMGSSLLRTEKPDNTDYSTVFISNMLFSLLVYAVAYLIAPFVASFFDQPTLTLIIRVYCLTFIIASLSIVQSTKLNKEIRFKTQMMINIPAMLAGGSVGIYMAYNGFGVWSLVWMNLTKAAFGTILLWVTSGWIPKMVFDLNRFKMHWNFGYKLTLSSLSNSLFNHSYHIAIGKFFPPAQLGFYTRANSLKQLPVDNITNAISKVSYPLLASIQNDTSRLKSIYSRMMTQMIFWLAPLMLTAIIIAEPLFRFLLTEKWLPAVPYFQILCIAGIMYSWRNNNLNILKVLGKSNRYLKLELFYNFLTISSLALIPFGIQALVWGQVIAMFISLLVNIYFSGSLINYTLKDQLKDMAPIIVLSILSGLFSWLLFKLFQLLEFTDFLLISIIPLFTLLFHICMAWLFKMNSIIEFRNIILKNNNG